jgi:hypothetical protein
VMMAEEDRQHVAPSGAVWPAAVYERAACGASVLAAPLPEALATPPPYTQDDAQAGLAWPDARATSDSVLTVAWSPLGVADDGGNVCPLPATSH